jgi:O-antigen/teichoic acid export membrane protein
MEYVVDRSLKEVVKGSGIVFFGRVFAMGVNFLSTVLIIKYFTLTEYGIYSLLIAFLPFFVAFSTLGLHLGTPRQISYFKGKNEPKVRNVINSSLQISIVVAIILSVILYLSSNFLSNTVFHSTVFSQPLKISSIAIPFYVLMIIIVSIYRGFNRVDVKVYFLDILRAVFFLSFLTSIIIFALSFMELIYAYVLSFVIACLVLTFYTMRTPLPIKIEKKSVLRPRGKELLAFSLPLLVNVMLNMVLMWGGTVILGYFKSLDVVGLYSGAFILAAYILFVLTSTESIYLPIASQLYSRNLIEELRRTYQVLTKWIFSAALPTFLILFLFPELILSFLFGLNYIPASLALRILTLGFIFPVLLGLNTISLLVLGKTRLIMYIGLIGALVYIGLNILLIPLLGIEGAALASTSSYIIVNLISSTKLYQFEKIHPFSKNYLKLIVNSFLLMSLIYIVSSFIKIEFWMLPIFLIVFLSIYFVLLFLTRSVDKEDIDLLLALEKNLGVNATTIKRILKKFV